MFSQVYLVVFRNDYGISGDTFFISFILKNFFLIVKANGKVNLHLFNRITRFFISNTLISNARLKLAKNQAKAKHHPETELPLFENACFFHPKMIQDILKNVEKLHD